MIVLDSGALIALERNDRSMWAALRVAAQAGEDVLVPSTVLAQVWRGTSSQARLALALAWCQIAAFDPLAKVVGELCGKAGTSDVCDAHVAVVSTRSDAVYTSDPNDIRRLLVTLKVRRPKVVRC